ncbi:hypothetical protein ACLOJK_014943 [Asimina triloba]
MESFERAFGFFLLVGEGDTQGDSNHRENGEPQLLCGGIDAPGTTFKQVDKDKGKNAKQFTWILLVQAHHTVRCLTWVASVLWALVGTINKMLIFWHGVAMESVNASKGWLLLVFIRASLMVALVILAFEVVAHMNGRHFQRPDLYIPQSTEIEGWVHLVYLSLLSFWADYIAAPILALSNFRYKKIALKIEGDPFKYEDLEGSDCDYPMVLVQIPMCNEREKRLSGVKGVSTSSTGITWLGLVTKLEIWSLP